MGFNNLNSICLFVFKIVFVGINTYLIKNLEHFCRFIQYLRSAYFVTSTVLGR